MSAYKEFRIGWPVVLASMVGIAFGMSPLPFYTIGVFAGPLAVEVVGLDVTNDVRVTPAVAAALKARADNPAAAWWDRVLDANDWFIESGEYYYWDVLAAMTVVDPARFCRGETMPLTVAAAPTDKPWLPGSDLSMPGRAADSSPAPPPRCGHCRRDDARARQRPDAGHRVPGDGRRKRLCAVPRYADHAAAADGGLSSPQRAPALARVASMVP